MIYKLKPTTFNSKFCVSGCFLQIEEKSIKEFLMFLRQDHKPQPNTWSVPAGKIEKGETPEECMIRELKEETGLMFSESDLIFHKKFYILYNLEQPNFEFEYNIYSIKLDLKPKIKMDLNDHKEFRWVTPKEALELNLIPDEEPCIRLVYGI
jgi:8-oxo-dGTP diphosphatase